jgi:DNA repair photolyase
MPDRNHRRTPAAEFEPAPVPAGAQPVKGRGAVSNPTGRFEPIRFAPEESFPDDEAVDDVESPCPEPRAGPPRPATVYLEDVSRSAIAWNDSPDVGFEASINPYRGCEHGCVYCYARPYHEYLGFGAGLDFETKILVKRDLPALLEAELRAKRWKPRVIVISGVTDAYQPVERRLRLTRACIEVLARFRNPLAIITKSALVARDVDLLADMARDACAAVNVSLTTLDRDLQRTLEPRASTPEQRLAAIRTLSDAGVPVGVMTAPVIPGLTDHELPALLQAAKDAGARSAGYVVVRLPYGVKELFDEWLLHHRPERREKVLHRIQSLRGGRLNDPRFGSRMEGEGEWAHQIKSLFETGCRKAGLSAEGAHLSTAAFCVPGGQLPLFSAGVGP